MIFAIFTATLYRRYWLLPLSLQFAVSIVLRYILIVIRDGVARSPFSALCMGGWSCTGMTGVVMVGSYCGDDAD